MRDKSITEIFGKDIHHHVFFNIGDKDKSSVCHIEDFIPLFEMEQKIIQEKIEILKQFKGTNVCVPLNDYRSYYITCLRPVDEWLEKIQHDTIFWCSDSVDKGYKLIPCHPTEKAISDYQSQYNSSEKKKSKIENCIKYLKDFFKKNVK